MQAVRKTGFVAAVLLVLVLTGTLLAHEGREVGEYELEFGWRAEPALVGFANGPEVTIALHGSDDEHTAEGGDDSDEPDPLAGVPVALQVEVSFGPALRTLELLPVPGAGGHFAADLVPTRPGDYTFRVFGTIGDLAVDETFTSAAGEFSSVEPQSDVTFPDEVPSMVELLERIALLEARITALEGG